MTDLAKRALFGQQVALACFLDIQGAFDMLSSTAIVKGMREHGVEEDLTQWFTQYLQHQVCEVSGQEGHYLIKNGTGQGGVLSPVVWNYTMDSFLIEFNSGQVKAIGYADDGALVVVCRELATARKLMQAALRKAYASAKRTGLKFSSSKTTAVIFSEYKTQLSTPLILGGVNIEAKDRVTYLGVLLDCNLSWVPHITQKVAAAKCHLIMLRGIAGPTWGPPPHIMKWLYTCMVQPALKYGAMVWATSTQLALTQSALQKAQRWAYSWLLPCAKIRPRKGLQ
jgi:hypothetical protein